MSERETVNPSQPEAGGPTAAAPANPPSTSPPERPRQPDGPPSADAARSDTAGSGGGDAAEGRGERRGGAAGGDAGGGSAEGTAAEGRAAGDAGSAGIGGRGGAPAGGGPRGEGRIESGEGRAEAGAGADAHGESGDGEGGPSRNRRRRGSRGGRGRGRAGDGDQTMDDVAGDADDSDVSAGRPRPAGEAAPGREATAGAPVAAAPAAMPKPRIGDSRPAPAGPQPAPKPAGPRGAAPSRPADADDGDGDGEGEGSGAGGKKRRRRRRGGGGGGGGEGAAAGASGGGRPAGASGGGGGNGPRRNGRSEPALAVVGGLAPGEAEAALAALDDADDGPLTRERALGRYLMAVHVQPEATQIAVLEGRSLVQHVVSRPQNDSTEIDGNIYLARVQNVLPGMEAAFIDIGTPKNAVLYRGDVRFDKEDVEGGGKGGDVRIEQVLKGGQTIICQVTKNPIAHKGARLTQDVSLPGRFVVLVPNSDTYGISKRLADDERKRLRRILDSVKPQRHGIIVRTAAEGCDADELRRDVARLVGQWEQIEELASHAKVPSLLYREPDIAVRFIREELNKDFRAVVIDDPKLYEEVRSYVASINPELAGRIQLFDTGADPLPLFERHHVHEQLHKAVDRKVWLPSGGSLIIERTEALTVIDVNTGKNVGKTNLEETVFRNNLEAAAEVARQLRLRDIGGIIVIDFIDMEIKDNRAKVEQAFRQALARDKTRVQVFNISELGLIEMTRKRISEGLVESLSGTCPICEGRGFVLDQELLG
jgi:ribonuclease E